MSLTSLFFLGMGVYLIIVGVKGQRLINESEFPATAQERKDLGRPSRIERLFVTGLGIASCCYGLYRIIIHR